jgi:hypothetical protein
MCRATSCRGGVRAPLVADPEFTALDIDALGFDPKSPPACLSRFVLRNASSDLSLFDAETSTSSNSVDTKPFFTCPAECHMAVVPTAFVNRRRNILSCKQLPSRTCRYQPLRLAQSREKQNTEGHKSIYRRILPFPKQIPSSSLSLFDETV